ncbi:MAG: SDR family NAD(P)-dependent oxidoreductase [Solirubrobacterales bacterium]
MPLLLRLRSRRHDGRADRTASPGERVARPDSALVTRAPNPGGPLTGKVALVTGAGRGIGRACAIRLARLGARTVSADLEHPGGSGGGNIVLDVGDRGAVESQVAALAADLGRIDVLVCAAGVLGELDLEPASGADDERFEASLRVNLMGTVNCCRAAAPHLMAHGWGKVVTFSSLAAMRPLEDGRGAPYVVAKAAIVGYTYSLAAELGPHGVTVNALAPGSIDTPMTRAAFTDLDDDAAVGGLPLRRHGTPEDCAGVVEFLCTPLSDYVTGQVICVDGGLSITDALTGSGLG